LSALPEQRKVDHAMRTVKVDLPDETAARIEEAARHHGLSLDELIRASVEEKLERDADFETASRRALSKNAALYERLA
jgi:Arc/MetJ-type ribon-helix-helix transcriptional regulator